MINRPPAELRLWTWLKANGLGQSDLADGLERSNQHVSHRIRYAGFTAQERKEVLAWAKKVRPSAKVTATDLFEPSDAEIAAIDRAMSSGPLRVPARRAQTEEK